jgi:hypothetical protein
LTSLDPQPYDPADGSSQSRSASAKLYDTLYQQASHLVEKPANILTFSTPQGFVHMLRHIQPELCYVVEALSGADGANIASLRGSVGQVVVIVGGGESGGLLAGLVDTDVEDDGAGSAVEEGKERERGRSKARDSWWVSSDMIGLGKGVEIVDGARLVEDFERRVGGRD